MDIKKYTNANREAWDEVAPIHAGQTMEKLLQGFSQPGYVCFDEQQVGDLQEIGVADQDVAQICCNNGRELISIKNLGAQRCVGFDCSAEFLKQAEQLNKAAKTDCEFICTDIYDIDHSYDESFDLVYISIGVFGWMPDLMKFFALVSRLLKPGSMVYINEQHPILDMIEPGDKNSPVSWDYSYFKSEPFEDNNGLDYYGGKRYESKTRFFFHHKLSDIFTAAIENGLVIDAFEELPDEISATWHNVEHQGPKLPMSYVLVLYKDQ